MFNLRKYFERGRDYQVFVGSPPAQPNEWLRVDRLDGNALITAQGDRLPLPDVRAAIVAYSTGEILEAANAFGPFPDGIGFLEYGEPVTSELDPSLLEAGRVWTVVRHHDPRRGPDGEWCYQTTIENVSDEPVKVTRFGGYAKRGNRWMLDTASGGFYSAEQFVAWYGLDVEYIPPSGQVSDPDNYGAPGSLWAYFCKTASGREFICGAEAPAETRASQ